MFAPTSKTHIPSRVRKKRRGLRRFPDPLAQEVRREDAVASVHPHRHPVRDDPLLASRKHEVVEPRVHGSGAEHALSARAGKRRDETRGHPLKTRPHSASSPGHQPHFVHPSLVEFDRKTKAGAPPNLGRESTSMNAVTGLHGPSRTDGDVLNFCVVETFALGDLVYLTAFLYGLRAAAPRARIRVVTGLAGTAFAFPEDLAVEVFAADWPWVKVDWWRRPIRSMRAILRARRSLAPMSGSWVGLDPRGDIRHKYLLRRLKVRDVVKDTSRLRSLGRLLGQSNRHVLEDRQEYLDATCRKLGIERPTVLRWPWATGTGVPEEESRRVILAPEAGAALREWPQERWILLSRELRSQGWRTELVVHNLTWERFDISSDFDRVIAGSVRDLSHHMQGAAFVIAVDSFVGHYAAAHGIPVLSLFGPTLVERWKPWGHSHAVVQHDGYACRPCLQVRCVQPEASCMSSIAVSEVVDLLKLMTETKHR